MQTILVVDDVLVVREPIAAALRKCGFQVLTATNGMEALEAIAKERPDLVLLDLGMPELDGLSVLREIRVCPMTKTVPVIILSAEINRTRILEAAKLGISGYLLKSQFSVQAIRDSVQRALAASSLANPRR